METNGVPAVSRSKSDVRYISTSGVQTPREALEEEQGRGCFLGSLSASHPGPRGWFGTAASPLYSSHNNSKGHMLWP